MPTVLKSRRGVTLAEIMVALALVAIMIALTISFTTLITGRTTENKEQDTRQQDFLRLEASVESWLKANPTALPDGTGKILTADTYTLQFAYGTLSGTLPEGKKISLRTETVTGVTFERLESGSEILWICTVTCENSDPYVFCINPREGEGGAA